MRKLIKFIGGLLSTKTKLEFNENSIVPEITKYPNGHTVSIEADQLLGHPIISKAMQAQLKRVSNGNCN
jgi:hypothetical protein